MIFTETAGAGVYTARIGVARGGTVSQVSLIPVGLWAAATAVLDMGDDLTAADSYFSAYDVKGLASVYNPTAPVAGTNFDNLQDAGNDYVPESPDGSPGVLYAVGDVLTAVITTTGGGGTTGLFVVQVTGYGIPSVVHRAAKA